MAGRVAGDGPNMRKPPGALRRVVPRRAVLGVALAGTAAILGGACDGEKERVTSTVRGASRSPTIWAATPSAVPLTATAKPSQSGGVLAGPKRKVETLGSIPSTAELIVSSQLHGKVGKDGLPAFELYVLDARGENLTQITFNGYTHNHFAVSPNRKLIACNRYAADTTRDGKLMADDRKVLWVLDLEKKEEWFLVPGYDAGFGGIDWSPDGQYIYCSMAKDDLPIDENGRTDPTKLKRGTTNNAPKDIYRIRPDGRDFQKITDSLEKGLGASPGGKWVSDTGVSHDGQWLVFLCVLGNARKTRIAVSRTDGTQPRFVTDGGPLPPGMRGPWSVGDFDPEFSPADQYICCQRVTDVGYNFGISTGDIVSVKLDSGEVRDLSPAGHTATHGIPDWGEDNRVVCTEWSQQDTWYGPVLLSPDAQGYQRVDKAKFCSHARWIPKAKESR